MACNSVTLANIARDCEPNLGGIKTVYLAIWENGIFTVTDGEVTGVKSGTTWYQYNFRRLFQMQVTTTTPIL